MPVLAAATSAVIGAGKINQLSLVSLCGFGLSPGTVVWTRNRSRGIDTSLPDMV